ncbi:hypothetical protein TNCV_2887941 [Trichonephila clavipes]|nr:hypothetical protein TNCV_2887941 [Trichonephila clavipes]
MSPSKDPFLDRILITSQRSRSFSWENIQDLTIRRLCSKATFNLPLSKQQRGDRCNSTTQGVTRTNDRIVIQTRPNKSDPASRTQFSVAPTALRDRGRFPFLHFSDPNSGFSELILQISFGNPIHYGVPNTMSNPLVMMFPFLDVDGRSLRPSSCTFSLIFTEHATSATNHWRRPDFFSIHGLQAFMGDGHTSRDILRLFRPWAPTQM